MSDIVERLRSNKPLPICPFDRMSPEYYTTPNDKPCKFCGGEPEGPDKCTGADTRIMGEAAEEITRLRAALSEAEHREKDARRVALGDAAEAIFVMGAWSPHYEKLTPNTFDEGTSAAYEIVSEMQGEEENAAAKRATP
ncbi:hypothetical protein [Agrobacterium rosae]|uniref:Uncharacterized protein n=1 Tax=Agrobacterium rosae TaxID=1972867 RepID=A0AAW9FJG1_9HYPH|nr:hypothetical protein [Agrobacterium rosae]MDX8305625.1 hypothetical protein [Agrobacterium rosae]